MCPVAAKATSDVHRIMGPHAGGRNLTPQIAMPNTKGFQQRDRHPLPSDPAQHCPTEEVVLMVVISCMSASVGQETPLPEFRHPPAGAMERFNPGKGDVLAQLPVEGKAVLFAC